MKRLGFVGIIIDDRVLSAPRVNEVLTRHGDGIIARTGLPYKERKCHVITLMVEMTTDELGSLTESWARLKGLRSNLL